MKEVYFNNDSNAAIYLYKANQPEDINLLTQAMEGNFSSEEIADSYKLYQEYAKSECNHIDKYVRKSAVNIINIDSSHTGWLKNQIIYNKMAENILFEYNLDF